MISRCFFFLSARIKEREDRFVTECVAAIMCCKACGGADRSRRSSVKRAHYIPPPTKRFLATNGTNDTVAVRTGLRNFCTDLVLSERIREDVGGELSALAVEASLRVHFRFTKLLHADVAALPQTTATLLVEFYTHLLNKREKSFTNDREFFSRRRTRAAAADRCPVYHDGKNRNCPIQNTETQHLAATRNRVDGHTFALFVTLSPRERGTRIYTPMATASHSLRTIVRQKNHQHYGRSYA